MTSTPAQLAHLRRNWKRRTQDCRALGLCIRCRREFVGPGQASCARCKLLRKIAWCTRGDS